MCALRAPNVEICEPFRTLRGATSAVEISQGDTAGVGWVSVDELQTPTIPRNLITSTNSTELPQDDTVELGCSSFDELNGSITPRGLFQATNRMPFPQNDTGESGWVSLDDAKRSSTPRGMFASAFELSSRDSPQLSPLRFDTTEVDWTLRGMFSAAFELSSRDCTPLNPLMFGPTNDLAVTKLGDLTEGSGMRSYVLGEATPSQDEHRHVETKAALTATTPRPPFHSKAVVVGECDGDQKTCPDVKGASDDAHDHSCKEVYGHESAQERDVAYQEGKWNTHRFIESSSSIASSHCSIPPHEGESCAQQAHQQEITKAVPLDAAVRKNRKEHCANCFLHLEALQLVKSWFALGGFSTWPANALCKQLMMKEEIDRKIVDSWFALGPALDFHEWCRPGNNTRTVSAWMDTIGFEQVWTVTDEPPRTQSTERREAEASAAFVDSWFELD